LLPFCDYFIVLNDGKIAERGSGDELLARRGLFYDLYHADGAPTEQPSAARAAV
jgi:ABC-type multidrug transport system fused ATPase/permease subunit